MPSRNDRITLVDGSVDFSGGVNSYLTTTIASERNPNGMPRNQVSWMDNGTVRGGGITQRAAWKKRGNYPDGAVGLYQGKFMYEPDEGNPYLIFAIGGDIWKMDVDNPASAVNLSAQFSDTNALYTITGQVHVVAQQVVASPPAPPTGALFAVGPQSPYTSFITPGNGNNVVIPTTQIITDPVGTKILGNEFQIVSSGGWITNPITFIPHLSHPANLARYYFAQAEQFLIVQAGDLQTLPIFWDGLTLRRSNGLGGGGNAPNSTGYGTLVGTTSAPFTMPTVTLSPAIAPTLTISLTAAYPGSVGDRVNLLISSTSSGGIVTGFSQVGASFQVMSIGVNAITVSPISQIAPFLPGVTVSPGASLFVLYFETGTPSKGAAGGGTPEIPSAQSMDYYMGRLWYAQGRKYTAGDIVFGSSGTGQYDFRDSVLKVTENPLAIGGDGFSVPTNSGNIRAIRHNANINTQLGQGQLYIFTRKSVFALTVPVSRSDWIAAGNQASGTQNAMPLQTVVLVENGAVNDRSITTVNGDLFFQSIEPGIRSVITAVRNFTQWGNVPISVNEQRILRFQDRSLMQFCSGVAFDNRMIQTVLPYETPVGVAHKAIVPLNFDNISTLQATLPPVWEGMWEGINTLELAGADFGGRQRAFATVWSDETRRIELWELTDAEQFDGGDNRVVWYVEFPSFTWGDEFLMKKLVSAEIWLDRIYGEVNFTLDYHVDCDPCWYPWNRWRLCTARDSCETVHQPNCLYPTKFGESFRQTISMPLPPNACQSIMGRPANVGFQFQPRLAIKGFCRIRGILLKAEKVEQEMYSDMVCP